MTIAQIKTQIGQPVLNMIRQLDQDPQFPNDPTKQIKTQWLSHWDNDNRVRVTMHEEVFNLIKADKAVETLAVKKQVVEATQDRAAYTRYVVITPANIEAAF